ncbi:hypothetical protein F7725_011420 [Dissostichus mawsoni]|uniref:Proteasome alpha-type subunits domain-containing protein n=1 Tax=Dissostichus mawsoni TaxID=36200 RepID=A0A7J5ZAZ0_DISMA|nr:hypothetical protein F7725_011420 [Dissostichus mawsoni]
MKDKSKTTSAGKKSNLPHSSMVLLGNPRETWTEGEEGQREKRERRGREGEGGGHLPGICPFIWFCIAMAARYDRAITVFSPDGHLFQVEYAQEAVKKGSTAVGIRGKDIVVLGVEKKSVAKLQEERTVRKICALDEHVCMAFAGLTADARIVINRARVECQSHRLTVEDPVTVEYITRYIATLKQRYTQSNGRRPFGISALIVGFDDDGTPGCTRRILQEPTMPGSAKTVREFLEKNYTDEAIAGDNETIKLTIKALLEVVQSGGKNIELAIIRRNKPLKILEAKEIESLVAEIEKEKEEEAEKKKQKGKST